MATRPDYYKALGVDKKASADEIKKAYRKLARRYHPDRNPDDKAAEARFKEVSQAYDVLGDPEKRKQYDSGTGAFATGGPGGGFGGFGNFDFDASSMGDILSNLFGGSGRAQRQRQRAERGGDLEAAVSISFDQAIAGAQVPLSVPMRATCETCHGTGAKPGTTPSVCPRCEGRGIETQGQGMFSISQPCSLCGGAGTVIEDPCPTCHGSGAVRTVKRLRVNIPPGVRDGSRIRLAGKGEPGRNGGPPGDLYLITPGSASAPLRSRRSKRWPRRSRAPGGPGCSATAGRASRAARPARRRARAASRQVTADEHRRTVRERGRLGPPPRGGLGATHRGSDRPRRVHDLGRCRARQHAPADAAHVRGARSDRAQALAQGHAPVLAGGR